MATKSDWFPASRDEQLAITKARGSILPAKKTAWNIPTAAITELTGLTNTADTALAAAKNEGKKGPWGPIASALIP
jgi:hypothetical protein